MEEAFYVILAGVCGSQAVACAALVGMFRGEPVIGLIFSLAGCTLTVGTFALLKFGGVF